MDLNFSQEFKSLLSSPLGTELVRELNVLADSYLESARREKTADKAFGLLKQVDGVMLAIEHLQSLAVVPENEGS